MGVEQALAAKRVLAAVREAAVDADVAEGDWYVAVMTTAWQVACMVSSRYKDCEFAYGYKKIEYRITNVFESWKGRLNDF